MCKILFTEHKKIPVTGSLWCGAGVLTVQQTYMAAVGESAKEAILHIIIYRFRSWGVSLVGWTIHCLVILMLALCTVIAVF